MSMMSLPRSTKLSSYQITKVKKKTKPIEEVSQKTNFRIFDDDIDLHRIKKKKVTDDLDIYFGVNEDKPIVEGVIDDRPQSVKNKDARGSKWKPLAQDEEKPISSADHTEKGRSSKERRRNAEDVKNSKDSKRVKVKHGITSAAEMKYERQKLKEEEAKMFKKLGPEISGKGAKSVYRDKKTGRLRDLEKEAAEAASREKELEIKTAAERQKFKDMTVGLKQVEENKKKLEAESAEMQKPLARYRDDADLDDYLKSQQKFDDPMFHLMREQKEKEEQEAHKTEDKKPKLSYRGPVQPPPNRFNILPGHRWDGVDRSNGYEKKYFASLAEKEALKEEAYRWSTQDM